MTKYDDRKKSNFFVTRDIREKLEEIKKLAWARGDNKFKAVYPARHGFKAGDRIVFDEAVDMQPIKEAPDEFVDKWIKENT